MSPLDAIADPTRPPISAWDELDGSPKNQVTMFQAIAPSRPAKTSRRDRLRVDEALRDRAATSSEMNAPTKLSSDAKRRRRGLIARVEIAVAIDVRGVVEPVREIERERGADDEQRMMSPLILVNKM